VVQQVPPDVEIEPHDPVEPFLLVIRPRHPPLRLSSWVDANRNFLRAQIPIFGAVWLTGFDVDRDSEFASVAAAVSDRALDYVGGVAPRKPVADGLYTSTEVSRRIVIPQHNEMAYLRRWPELVLFFCTQPAAVGGETPLTSSRAMRRVLGEGVLDVFAARGVRYTRRFRNRLHSWQQHFETTDPRVVDDWCRANQVDAEWDDGELVSIQYVAQGTATHRSTGERVLFNQAYNQSAWFRTVVLPAAVPASSATETAYGDGSPIEPAILQAIHGVHEEHQLARPWSRGDVVVVDNLLAAHGRRSFSGERRVIVALREPNVRD
jgi:hypothetical protein